MKKINKIDIICIYNWFYTRGGKEENVMYLYSLELDKNVIFNHPRDKEEFINYSLIESLKDRVIVNTKYEPAYEIMLKCIHVIVFANFFLESCLLS